jgi:hypothetical protein
VRERTKLRQNFDAGAKRRDVVPWQPILPVRNKGSHAPRGSQAEAKHEGYANATSGNGVVAPALEHGYHSNNEEYDRDCGERLKPHVFSPSIMLPGVERLKKERNHRKQ